MMVKPSSQRPMALFNFSNPWMQRMILESATSEFDVRFIQHPDETKAVFQQLRQAAFLVTIELTANWIRHLDRCQLVQLQGVGYDAVDIDFLSQADIPLAATPEGTTVGVAEHTLLLMLGLCKRIVEVHQSMAAGRFDKIGFRQHCHVLSEKTVGIVGFGRIGRRVAQLADAFGCRVLYTDLHRHQAGEEEPVAEYRAFDDLLAESDFVTVHTPLNGSTDRLFAHEQFARMKTGACFINTSRGGVCHLNDLYEALHRGHLGGAGLDVFDPQPPPPDHPLLQLANVICTPHMATGTVESHRQKAAAQFANFRRVLRGQVPLNQIWVPDSQTNVQNEVLPSISMAVE